MPKNHIVEFVNQLKKAGIKISVMKPKSQFFSLQTPKNAQGQHLDNLVK